MDDGSSDDRGIGLGGHPHDPQSARHPASTARFEALLNVSSGNTNQGQPSRDILDHKSAARPSLGGAQLRSADTCSDRRARGRSRRPRPSCLGANRLGQNRRIWVGNCKGSFGRFRAIRAGSRTPCIDRRTNAGTRLTGASRTRMALSICGCARRFLRRRHGSAPRTTRTCRRRSHRGRHAGAAEGPYRAQLA
ncbi:hypothetical protein GALL_514220 [mine drainage metagenome]|uniref:Uncharacterized protein n=1 Tax=mine drainage metagenome TaxID=410659 RepID=A0A1J5PHJ6_9ZZZZ